MAEVNLSGVFTNSSETVGTLTIDETPTPDLVTLLIGSSSLTITGLTVRAPADIHLTLALDGFGYLSGRLSKEPDVVDAYYDLTDRAVLSAGLVTRVMLVPPDVIVTRSRLGWLGPPLVEYHDDRSSSVVTIPSVGTGWTVVSGGTVLAVNGVQVRQSAEDEIFDGVYEP